MSNLIFKLLDTTSAVSGANGEQVDVPWWYQYSSLIIIALMLVVMYFLMIRPQRKRQKEEQNMRNNLRVGDQITTIGGICGRILNVKEDAIVIETGADRSKMTIKRWAVASNETVHDTPVDDDFDDDDD